MSSLRLPAASLYLTVIVTGGSDGYGKGIAKILKIAGADVWITGRNEKNWQNVPLRRESIILLQM